MYLYTFSYYDTSTVLYVPVLFHIILSTRTGTSTSSKLPISNAIHLFQNIRVSLLDQDSSVVPVRHFYLQLVTEKLLTFIAPTAIFLLPHTILIIDLYDNQDRFSSRYIKYKTNFQDLSSTNNINLHTFRFINPKSLIPSVFIILIFDNSKHFHHVHYH